MKNRRTTPNQPRPELTFFHRATVLGLLVAIASIGMPVNSVMADGHKKGNAEKMEAHIKYRQKMMGAVGANMGAIGDILKNGLDLPGHLENHGRQLSESADLIAAAFKVEAARGATDAKPKIWRDWAGFEEAIAKFKKASDDFATAAASGDPKAVGPAMRALGKSCGSCHKPYRKAKEESYKNK